LTKLERDQAEITAQKFRGLNDPDAIREVAAQQVARQAIDDMAYVQHIPDPWDPRLIVRPHDKRRYGELAKATDVLLREASVPTHSFDPRLHLSSAAAALGLSAV
jgi:hypothetical protein